MQRTSLLALGLWMLAAGNAHAENPVSVLQTMNKMMDKLSAGDVEGARRHALSYEEFASISRRKMEKKEYQDNLDGFLKMIAGELRAGVKLERIGHADALILPAGEKTRGEVVMAVVHATFRLKEKQTESDPIVFLFIAHGGQWKFFLRK
jgi:hypothetical protein